MNNARTNAFAIIGPLTPEGEVRLRPRPLVRKDRQTRISIATFIAALPVLAVFVMWLTDPQGLMDFYATRTGQALLFASFIWVGIGVLEVRRMVFSRTARRLHSPPR